jgi:glycosyltransferase involved in cell wall biosynthesis
MHIWIFNHYACLRHGSGLTSHAVMAQTLAASGHEVTIFPAAFAQSHAPSVEIDGRRPFIDRFDGAVRFRFVRTLPYRTVPGRLLNMLSYRKNVGRCTAGLHRPDVIIGSLSHPHAVEAARRLARRFDCRFVYEIRDIWPQSLVELGGISRLHPMYWHFRALERHAFRHADGVISVLPGIAQYAAQHGVAASRAAYIPNGIDPNMYPDPPSVREIVHGKTRIDTEKGKGEPFVVSCFTRFGSGNAMDTIIDAAANLQRDPNGGGITIRLVGDGPTRAGLQRRTAELGLQNVEFLDLVSKPELVTLAHQSHAFVHSHRAMPVVERYGMSVNKVFAFMASGRPVIFACRCCYDPIRDAKAGVSVEPEDPAAMARAMIDLRDLPAAERAAMGHRARRYVLEHHDLSKIAKRLEAFLESIL